MFRVASLIPLRTVKLGNINKTKQLELYKEEFEAAYLENTRDYYERESASYIAANGVSAYMIKVGVLSGVSLPSSHHSSGANRQSSVWKKKKQGHTSF
jgi:hypothetical protein